MRTRAETAIAIDRIQRCGLLSGMAISSVRALQDAWRRFQAEHPKIRIREAARELKVSEAQLVATACGEETTQLSCADRENGWGAVLQRIPDLGRVMALTRNEHCVHERKGHYRDVGIFGSMGSVVGPDIDLRFFLQHWRFAFAVREKATHGPRESLQFFDRTGAAVHKIYLQPESDRAAFESLAADFAHGDQRGVVEIEPAASPTQDPPDDQVDARAFAEGWRALQDTHEFFGLLKTHGLGRRQALRLIGPEFARPLSLCAGETLLRTASERAAPIMVFVANPGMIQIHTGAVQRIAPHGEWINVLDADFNLHLRQTAVSDAWAVRKPTAQGEVTSVELFEAGGGMIAQFFGKRKPGQPEMEEWRALVATL